MTMEYIYFVSSIAAIGLFVILFWRISATSRKNRALLDESARLEPVPPLKKTINGGPSEKELEEIRFQEKVEMWQRGFGVRHAWHNRSNHQSLNGQKYTYEPPRKSRVEERKAAQQSAGSSQGSHGWQMIG
jgi:hypothetical protein